MGSIFKFSYFFSIFWLLGEGDGFIFYFWVSIFNLSQWMRLYHLFGFFWVTQFVIACHIMVIAGAVSIWYFSR